ncbi:40S ribosomal protein S5-1 [Hordeum vulgare]|nr:40S ribosomal protein S5-1 [Hordeum vulgare]
MKHPQSIKMREGMVHIHDIEGPKKTGSVETRLEAMEQQDFKCQEMVERGLNANHMMITGFTSNHKMDAINIGKHLSRLYDRVDQLQGQIYDLQNQNFAIMSNFEVGNASDSSAATLDWPTSPRDENAKRNFDEVANEKFDNLANDDPPQVEPIVQTKTF